MAQLQPQTHEDRFLAGGDVHDSLRAAAVVIGVASTVLYEAPAFGCRAFVRDSPLVHYYVGDRLGPTVKSESGLARVASENSAGVFSSVPAAELGTAIWAQGAVERFQTWAAGVPRQ